MTSPIKAVNVNEVYKAKKDLLNLAAQFHIYLSAMDYTKSYDIRQEMNSIKRTIREKYNIIL